MATHFQKHVLRRISDLVRPFQVYTLQFDVEWTQLLK